MLPQQSKVNIDKECQLLQQSSIRIDNEGKLNFPDIQYCGLLWYKNTKLDEILSVLDLGEKDNINFWRLDLLVQ